MPTDLLSLMAINGYGPVVLRDKGDGQFAATVGSRGVTVTAGTQALHFHTSVAVSWPADLGAEGGHDPISVALEELAHIHRPDLVTIDSRNGGDLIVNMWIPASDATPATIANAVYSTARIATLALSTVVDLVALFRMAAEDEAETVTYEIGADDSDLVVPLPPPG